MRNLFTVSWELMFYIQIVWYSRNWAKTSLSTYTLTPVFSRIFWTFVPEYFAASVWRIAAAEGVSFSLVWDFCMNSHFSHTTASEPVSRKQPVYRWGEFQREGIVNFHNTNVRVGWTSHTTIAARHQYQFR